MKKLIYLVGIILLMIGCTTGSEDTINGMTEQIIEANAGGFYPAECAGGTFWLGSNQIWEQYPGTTIPACPGSPCPPPIVPSTIPDADKIQIVFVAEGFKSNEWNAFNDRVACLISHFETNSKYEPFGSNSDKFQFWAYRIPSVEKGLSIQTYPGDISPPEPNIPEPVTYNTAWNVYRNHIGLNRYTHIPTADRNRLKDSLVKPPNGYAKNLKVFPVIVVNDSIYAASGEFPKQFGNNDKLSITIISLAGSTQEAADLMIHELGHSFADLDDEYVDTEYALQAPTGEPEAWFAPIKLNTRTSNPGGWFEGSRWQATGYWRSTNWSMMRSLSYAFSPLQIQLIQDRINVEYTGN